MPLKHWQTLLLVPVAGVLGYYLLTPPGPLDWRHLSRYRARLAVSLHPVAWKIRRQLKSGPADLEREIAATRAAGIPVSLNEVKRRNLTDVEDAAPEYEAFRELRSRKPLEALEDAAYRAQDAWHKNRSLSESQRADIRRFTDARADALAFAERAARKPYVASLLGMDAVKRVKVGSNRREVARLLRFQAFRLALDGRWEDAVQTQTLGFRIAEQTYEDGELIGFLVGRGCHTMTLSGMEDILLLAGPDARVAELVRSAIVANVPRRSLARALKEETASSMDAYEEYMTAGPAKLAELNIYGTADDEATEESWGQLADESAPTVKTPPPGRSQQQFVRKMLSAMGARYLPLQRRRIAVADAPHSIRRPVFKETSEIPADPRNPIEVMVKSLSEILGNVDNADTQTTAHQEVLVAAAAILASADRSGVFPDRMEQALSDLPADPFTGVPLQYRREGKGFVVYSVGQDGNYDGRADYGRMAPLGETAFRYPPPKAPKERPFPRLPVPTPGGPETR